MAVATSDTSARVGTGEALIDSSICVASTGLPPLWQARTIRLLQLGHLLGWQLYAEVAAHHHQAIAQRDDRIQMLDSRSLAMIQAREPMMACASSMSSGRRRKESATQSHPSRGRSRGRRGPSASVVKSAAACSARSRPCGPGSARRPAPWSRRSRRRGCPPAAAACRRRTAAPCRSAAQRISPDAAAARGVRCRWSCPCRAESARPP